MNVINALSMFAAMAGPIQSPQQEYESYLARYEGISLISGAFVARGGPVNQPTVSTFRVWKGGMYAVFMANREEHFDGKSAFMYAPVENKYVPSATDGEPYATIFGRRFSVEGKTHVVEFAKDGAYASRPARIYGFKREENQSPTELYVDLKTGRPLALMYYGQQASYSIEVAELHLKSGLAPFRPWAPPKGAEKSEVLPGR